MVFKKRTNMRWGSAMSAVPKRTSWKRLCEELLLEQELLVSALETEQLNRRLAYKNVSRLRSEAGKLRLHIKELTKT